MPQHDIECTVGQKPGDMESSIIEHVISVMQIKSKQLGNVSQYKKHEDNQMSRNTDLDEWLQRGSTKGSSWNNEHDILSAHTPQVGISMQLREDL